MIAVVFSGTWNMEAHTFATLLRSKGENVLIDKDGYCVIVDLGFGTLLRDDTSLASIFIFCCIS